MHMQIQLFHYTFKHQIPNDKKHKRRAYLMLFDENNKFLREERISCKTADFMITCGVTHENCFIKIKPKNQMEGN